MLNFRRFFSNSIIRRSEEKVQNLLNSSAIGVREKDEEKEEWSTSPYPERTIFSRERDQGKKFFRPKKDPRKTSIILFPGQGAQYVGMGHDLVKIPDAKDMYDLASEVLG